MKSPRFRFFSLVLFLSLLLSACGGYRVRVLESPENTHLKGHQKPYTVNGTRYDPILKHEGFVEEGIASWYGADFHGKKTSNGETYDMYAMTAAHKTLPLGVYVKVLNRANGEAAVVRVNDRGPFVRGRIIDLSFSAAKKLGVVGPGTAPVRIEALGYQVQDAAGQVAYRHPKSYEIGSYAIQVGAFTVSENAVRLKTELQRKYGSASVQQATVNGTIYHRVRAGKYDSLQAAEAARKGLEGQGYRNCFVVAME